MAKRGRPPRGEYPEKKRVFASRIREDTWQMLQKAAAESGRSLSQEFEHRLRRGLDEDGKVEAAFGDPRTFALMKMAAIAADSTLLWQQESSKASKVHWTASVEAFDRALKAIVDSLKVFRPLIAEDLVTGPPEVGTPALELVREIQAADTARSLDKTTKRQRAILRLKDELGELIDRPGRMLQAKKPKTERKKS